MFSPTQLPGRPVVYSRVVFGEIRLAASCAFSATGPTPSRATHPVFFTAQLRAFERIRLHVAFAEKSRKSPQKTMNLVGSRKVGSCAVYASVEI